jgi:hypothetical protein
MVGGPGANPPPTKEVYLLKLLHWKTWIIGTHIYTAELEFMKTPGHFTIEKRPVWWYGPAAPATPEADMAGLPEPTSWRPA